MGEKGALSHWVCSSVLMPLRLLTVGCDIGKNVQLKFMKAVGILHHVKNRVQNYTQSNVPEVVMAETCVSVLAILLNCVGSFSSAQTSMFIYFARFPK